MGDVRAVGRDPVRREVSLVRDAVGLRTEPEAELKAARALDVSCALSLTIRQVPDAEPLLPHRDAHDRVVNAGVDVDVDDGHGVSFGVGSSVEA
jgi:hypothetical protein